MSDCKKLFIINIILMGLISISRVLYAGIESVAALSAQFASGKLTEANLLSTSRLMVGHIGRSALLAVFIYVGIVFINYYYVKKNKNNDLFAFTILGIIVLVASVVLCVLQIM